MALLGHPELYGNTSTETGQIRNCCDWESVTASQVRLPDKLWKICQHSIALIDLNSINGTSIVKLVYLSSGLQTDEAWIQAFCTTTLWCCYFSILLIHLLQSDVIVKSTLTAGMKSSVRFSRSSVMPWSRSWGRFPWKPFIDSSGACPDIVRSRHWGAIHTTVLFYELPW